MNNATQRKQESVVEIANNLGWDVTLSAVDGKTDKCATFSKYSPAGEDFFFDLFYTDSNSLVLNIMDYWCDFDVDDHVMALLDAKRSGFDGVPSVRELVHDAEDIYNMVGELANAVWPKKGRN